jgi:hypothetical protein
MEKEEQASLRRGKGERHAHKTSERLSQGVLPQGPGRAGESVKEETELLFFAEWQSCFELRSF